MKCALSHFTNAVIKAVFGVKRFIKEPKQGFIKAEVSKSHHEKDAVLVPKWQWIDQAQRECIDKETGDETSEGTSGDEFEFNITIIKNVL